MVTSLSRRLVELAILLGLLSITVGMVQKLVILTTVYLRHIMGVTPDSFVMFGGVCFLFAIAVSGRKIVKFIEQKNPSVR